jgi:hypothetical protein
MQIKIKALADIEFLSAKVDKKHNIIHVQAKNLLDSTVILMDVQANI